MSKVRVVNFEPTSKGENTHLYIIENNSGASVTLCDLGASVVSIKVPDKNGSIRDVVLGYEHIDGYEFDGTSSKPLTINFLSTSALLSAKLYLPP